MGMMKAKRFVVAGVILLAAALLIGIFLDAGSRNKKLQKISGAYQALNFWSYQRAYPNSAIPDAGHYAAFVYAQQNFWRRQPGGTATVQPWQAIGPHNLGGRTLALAFNPLNPNTIYAGSASGGLWRSYSQGRGPAAWEYVPTGFPVLAVSCIAFAPEDSNTIYIGTGEVYNYQNAGTGAAFRNTRGTYGIGILKTGDGGATWTKSLDWSYHQQRGVWQVRVNPLNPNTIWAATTEGAYKSTDAGATWVQKHSVIMANDLVINPVDTNIVLVSCGNFGSAGHGIYRTTDGGETWAPGAGLPSPFYGKALLAIYPANPNIVYASIGNGFGNGNPPNASWLCRSTDAGATWSIRTTQDYSKHQGWFSHDAAVNPANPDEVIAIGIEIYKSTAGGSNLVQKSSTGWFSGRIPPGDPEGPPTYSHVDHHDVIYHPTNPNIIYFANDGGVFRSTDGGETYEACNGGYQTGQFYNGFASSPTDSLLSIGGFQDNATAIYDGQTAWIVRLIGGDGSWAGIDPVNSNILYGSWQNLNVLKSTNRGQSFFNISVPGSNRITCFIAPYVVARDNPNILYAGRDIIYKSTNGGTNWSSTGGGTPLDGNPALALAVSPQNSNVVYAATAPFATRSGVFRSLNGGGVWQNVTGSLPDRFPTDLAVHPTDPATVYLTLSGFGVSHVYKSSDYGGNWEDVGNGLPDVPANAAVIDPDYPNHIYIGNDLGVYVSIDGGNTWEDYSEGLPGAVIAMDLSISPLNRKLRVATHGNGAYERSLLVPVGIPGGETPLTGFALAQNYPNPFNATTNFGFRIADFGFVELKIFDVTGRLVRTLVSENRTPGSYTAQWDGRDDHGAAVASGVYVYRLSAGDLTASRRMVLAR